MLRLMLMLKRPQGKNQVVQLCKRGSDSNTLSQKSLHGKPTRTLVMNNSWTGCNPCAGKRLRNGSFCTLLFGASCQFLTVTEVSEITNYK